MSFVFDVLPALISAAGAVGGGLLTRGGKKETKIQKTQRRTIDDILESVRGEGPYSDLFSMKPEDFDKYVKDPAFQRFRSQTVPQIQQSFISEGQQRSTGLEDKLARAGVDLDQMLNKQYMQQQERSVDALKAILGQGAGALPRQTAGEAAGLGAAGYLTSGQEGFGGDIDRIFRALKESQESNQEQSDRKGFG